MLRAETLKKIREQMKSDAAAYKTLIKDLLVQVSHIKLFILTLGGFIGFDQTDGGKCDHQMQTKGQINS